MPQPNIFKPHRVETLALQPFSQLLKHGHQVDVTVVILDGEIFLNLAGHAHWLTSGDHFFIPATTPHAIQVGRHPTKIVLIHHHHALQPLAPKQFPRTMSPSTKITVKQL